MFVIKQVKNITKYGVNILISFPVTDATADFTNSD